MVVMGFILVLVKAIERGNFDSAHWFGSRHSVSLSLVTRRSSPAVAASCCCVVGPAPQFSIISALLIASEGNGVGEFMGMAGSPVCLGTATGYLRWLKYSSISFVSDVYSFNIGHELQILVSSLPLYSKAKTMYSVCFSKNCPQVLLELYMVRFLY